MTGALLARGRAADVFDAGEGRVLRRYRDDAGTDKVIAVHQPHV